MALKQLLEPTSTSEFLEQYFLKLPFALAGGCHWALDLGSSASTHRLLSAPNADIIASGPAGARRCVSPMRSDAIEESLARGESLGIRHAQRHDQALANLATDFADELLAPTDIHLYLTPADSAGFGWHYDAEDVFVLQTQGTKHWELRKNTVNPWPLVETLPDDMKYSREIMPMMRCTLEPGDWLYIPNGYWHCTRAVTESISLSIGIKTPSGVDLFDFMRPLLVNSLQWRQRLFPIVAAGTLGAEYANAALAAHMAELGRDMTNLLGDPAIATQFVEHCRKKSR